MHNVEAIFVNWKLEFIERGYQFMHFVDIEFDYYTCTNIGRKFVTYVEGTLYSWNFFLKIEQDIMFTSQI